MADTAGWQRVPVNGLDLSLQDLQPLRVAASLGCAVNGVLLGGGGDPRVHPRQRRRAAHNNVEESLLIEGLAPAQNEGANFGARNACSIGSVEPVFRSPKLLVVAIAGKCARAELHGG